MPDSLADSSAAAIAEKYRKDAIIDQAHALYGRQYSLNHIWSVILERTKDSRWCAHVIVYDTPGTMKAWTALKSGSKDYTRTVALESLMEGLAKDISARFFK